MFADTNPVHIWIFFLTCEYQYDFSSQPASKSFISSGKKFEVRHSRASWTVCRRIRIQCCKMMKNAWIIYNKFMDFYLRSWTCKALCRSRVPASIKLRWQYWHSKFRSCVCFRLCRFRCVDVLNDTLQMVQGYGLKNGKFLLTKSSNRIHLVHTFLHCVPSVCVALNSPHFLFPFHIFRIYSHEYLNEWQCVIESLAEPHHILDKSEVFSAVSSVPFSLSLFAVHVLGTCDDRWISDSDRHSCRYHIRMDFVRIWRSKCLWSFRCELFSCDRPQFSGFSIGIRICHMWMEILNQCWWLGLVYWIRLSIAPNIHAQRIVCCHCLRPCCHNHNSLHRLQVSVNDIKLKEKSFRSNPFFE